MVTTFEDLRDRITKKLGNSEDDLSILEDFTDTFSSESKPSEITGISKEEHEKAISELNEKWVERFKDRFSGKVKDSADIEEKKEESESNDYSIESLFEEKKEVE